MLSRAALSGLPHAVARPGYDAISTGIVHFGPGAFHRAHQADFVDRLLGHDPRWGIAEVSLRSGTVTRDLAAQDGFYTLELRDAAPEMRVIGAVSAVIGPGQDARLLAQLADPAVRLVTTTVTEKGYCLLGDSTLDFGHPDVVHDLACPSAPRSIIGWLVAGLAARRAAGVAAFSIAPCDNLPDNAGRVAAAVDALARRHDAGLADWIAGECRFAATMVDAITPAADAALLARVASATGCIDRAAVQRERFAQWVMADVLAPGSPDLASVGVVMTDDVAGFERAKLRILNGAHSSLAYLGLLRGADSVAAAMADERLAGFVARMISADVLPGIPPLSGFDSAAYVTDVFTRFRNPAIHHRLAQIAIDGSQKLPYRLLDSVAVALADGRSVARLLLPVAAWMRWIERAPDSAEIADPMAAVLWQTARDSGDPVGRLLGLSAVFPATLRHDERVRAALQSAWRSTANAADLDSALASLAGL